MPLVSNDDVLNRDEQHGNTITTRSRQSPPSSSWNIMETTMITPRDWRPTSSSWWYWCHRTAEEAEAVMAMAAAKAASPPFTTWIPPQSEARDECHVGSSDSRMLECYSFPVRLHRLLQDNDVSSIVSWDSHGRSFHIRDVKKFIFDVLLRYFHQMKLTSFRCLLHLYGFRQISYSNINRSHNRGSYYHEFFVRDDPDLCRFVVRRERNGKGGSGMTRQTCHGIHRNHHDSGTIPFQPLSMKPRLPTVIMTKKSQRSTSLSS